MTICSLRKYDNLLSRCISSDILNRKFPPKKPFRPENSDCAECVTFSLPRIKFNLSSYELDGWPTANIVLKVHTLFFLFFFFFFAYYVVLLLTVYWKADLALFLRPDLEKEKNKEQIWPGAVRLKIIILRAIIQSWNFADFDLYIGEETSKLRNLGFWQCKTIIMPLIPISCSSVSGCRRCLRCAKRCSLCSAVSCWHLLLRYSRWIWSRHSRSRGFSFHKLQIFISQTTDSHFAN